ncbi:MAG: S49 family peptidase [Verrucomicrobia bacterium]|nr:S49 family peptidase [Verrucomicrobiota bacterium]
MFAPRTDIRDGIGVLEITGALAYRPDLGDIIFDGVEDSAAVAEAFSSLEANPKVAGIVLNVNSPGGFSVGGAEIADAVFGASKPVVAWTGGMMCSLAYWIGSQADAVVAARSAMIGSIGAYVSLVDFHRMLISAGIEVKVFRNAEGTFKAAGIPGTEIPREHAEEFQRSAQRAFETFRADVLRARPGIGAESMRGQVFDGQQAKQAGLIDAIGGLDYALAVAKHLFARS